MVLSDEQRNPDLLTNFDKIFEIELPLQVATMNWNSQVGSLFPFSILQLVCKRSLFWFRRRGKIYFKKFDTFILVKSMLMRIPWQTWIRWWLIVNFIMLAICVHVSKRQDQMDKRFFQSSNCLKYIVTD